MSRLMAIGVSVICTISLGTALVAHADDVQDQKRHADRRIANLGQQLEGTNAKLATAYVKLERTKAAMPDAQARLASAQRAQAQSGQAQRTAEAVEARARDAEARARAHDEAIAQRLAVARAGEARAKEQLAKSSSELVSAQDTLDAYAAEVFQGGGVDSQLDLVFGGTSAQDFAEKLLMADAASEVATDTIDQLATRRADNTSTRSYLTAVRAEVAELKRQAALALRQREAATAAATSAKEQAVVAKNNAVTARVNAASAKSALDTLQAQQSTYAGELKTQKASEQRELVSARAESDKLKTILVERARLARIAEAKRQARIKVERRAPAASRDTTPSNFLSHPANGPTTSGFGMRWHPVLKKWMLHDGLDWAVACGSPVHAAADGQVIRAGWRPSGWGNQVLIDHGIHRGIDLVSSYNHMSRIVKFGGHVNRGQLIGYSGTTGYSTGCHLHFGTYEDGTPVNPRRWL